jgi:hypothetical protein
MATLHTIVTTRNKKRRCSKRLDMGRTSAGIGGYTITQVQHQKDVPDRTQGDAVLSATVMGKAHLALKRGR